MMKEVKDNMDNIREILGNATMAHTNMDLNIDGSKVVHNIFGLLDENKESIEKANKIDVKNNTGFKLNLDIINLLKKNLETAKKIKKEKAKK